MQSRERAHPSRGDARLRSRFRATLPVSIALIGVAVLTNGQDAGGCRAAQPVGTATCIACHDGRSASDTHEFFDGVHAAIDCEACHGAGSLHVRNVGRGSFFIENPQREPIPESTAVCSDCHEPETAGFLATTHAEAGVSCHACHDVHREGAMLFSTPNRARLTHDGYARSCGDCHSPEVEDYAHSRHFELPQITCVVCHDMHVDDTFTASLATNRLCLQCHQSRALGFTSEEIVDQHTGVFHPVDPAGTGASRCTKCHLPPLDAMNPVAAPTNHALDAVPPLVTNEAIFRGDPIVPANSCAGVVGCHDPNVPGPGNPHDPFDTDLNRALQGVFESIGFVPGDE